MDRHAGFAAAIMVRGQMIQDLQRIGYHAGTIGHRLTGSASGITADFFLDLPRLEFRAADDNLVRLSLRAWGPLTVTPDSGVPETRPVVLQTTLLVVPVAGMRRPTVETDPPQLTLALTGPTIVDLSVVPFAGGPFSADAQEVLDGQLFRTGLALTIGRRLDEGEPTGLDAGFLGGIAFAEESSIVTVVRDGALGIAIDVFDAFPRGVEPVPLTGVTTTGDRDALQDFLGSADIAISINSRAGALAFDTVRMGVAKNVDDAGADLDTYFFSVEDGHFDIGGSASSSEGSVDFSMKAVPHLTRPGFSREYDELWFDMRDIEVDVDLSWWAAALATLGSLVTLGFGVIVVEGFMAAKGTSVTADISRSSLQRRAARVQEFTLAGTTEPLIRLTLETFDCFADEVFITSTLRPQFPAPKLGGPYGVPVEEAIILRSVDFPVKLPFDVAADDPQLSIRWTVRRSDTGAVVFTIDRRAATVLKLRISHDFIDFLAAPEFDIECRVYRTLGPEVTEIFLDSHYLRIIDPVDRSHPFVHWSHEVWAPQVIINPNGSREQLGFVARGRRSKLHRTDLPGRCISVKEFSLNQIRDAGPGVTPSQIEYLDALPFDPAQLVAERGQVCDYCFFGGPTKTVPIVP